VWDVASGAELRRLEGRATKFLSASFGPDGRSFLTAASGGTIRLWSVSVDELLARAAALIQHDPPIFYHRGNPAVRAG